CAWALRSVCGPRRVCLPSSACPADLSVARALTGPALPAAPVRQTPASAYTNWRNLVRPLTKLLTAVAVTGLALTAACSSSSKKATTTTSSASASAASTAASTAATPAGSPAASGSSAAAAPTAASGGDVTLNLVAYSTPQPAYQALIAAFQKTPAGAHVKFTQSYGASGDQANSVVAGQAADVV